MRLLLVVLALALTGGAAIAADRDPEPEPAPAADSAGRPQEPVAAADREQAAAFSVLARPQSERDRLPQPALDVLRKGPSPDLGASAALARHALGTPAGVDVFVVPARGFMCLVTAHGVAACNRTAEARRGYVVSVETLPDGTHRVAGLVPDGTGEVTLTGADGGSERTAPAGNAFAFETAAAPAQVEWTGPDGPRAVRVGAG